MTKKEIGQILKKLRTDAGLTQVEVAAKIERSQQVVGHWETGYAQPDANTLFLLCDIYGVTVDEAFGFKPKKNMLIGHTEKVVSAYNKQPKAIQEAVDRLLEIDVGPKQIKDSPDMEIGHDLVQLSEEDRKKVKSSDKVQ